jgi:hypothetical protein
MLEGNCLSGSVRWTHRKRSYSPLRRLGHLAEPPSGWQVHKRHVVLVGWKRILMSQFQYYVSELAI